MGMQMHQFIIWGCYFLPNCHGRTREDAACDRGLSHHGQQLPAQWHHRNKEQLFRLIRAGWQRGRELLKRRWRELNSLCNSQVRQISEWYIWATPGLNDFWAEVSGIVILVKSTEALPKTPFRVQVLIYMWANRTSLVSNYASGKWNLYNVLKT